MDKKYQVFLSSTYEDLKEERQQVIQALLELDCIPAGMELFPAADEDQWSLIKSVIEDCDYYIVVIAGRYGSLAVDGVSYTQKEYQYALSIKKPIIAFIHKNPGSIPANKTEKTEEGKIKLENFRQLLRQRVCKEWQTAPELGSVVSRGLINLIKKKPAIGWVRGDLIPDDSLTKELLSLKKENEKLKQRLESLTLSPPPDIEALSQGQDPYEIQYHFELVDKKFSTKVAISETYMTTWDDIFSYVAPSMMNFISDRELRLKISEFIKINNVEKIKAKQGHDIDLSGLDIETNDFETIKIQLRALGLIRLERRETSSGKIFSEWILTEYGDQVMTKNRAIRKK